MTKPTIKLRDCLLDDAKMLYEWRNHPEIVAITSSKRTVEWDEHVNWLGNCLAEPHRHQIFLIIAGDCDIGVMRFDRRSRRLVTISVYLQPAWIGSGLGGPAIATGLVEIAICWHDLAAVEANVRRENRRAVRVFEKCGFVELPDQMDEIHTKLEYPVPAAE